MPDSGGEFCHVAASSTRNVGQNPTSLLFSQVTDLSVTCRASRNSSETWLALRLVAGQLHGQRRGYARAHVGARSPAHHVTPPCLPECLLKLPLVYPSGLKRAHSVHAHGTSCGSSSSIAKVSYGTNAVPTTKVQCNPGRDTPHARRHPAARGRSWPHRPLPAGRAAGRPQRRRQTGGRQAGGRAARRDGAAPFVVYLGRAADGEPVTITLLQPLGAGDTAARDRFVAEANAAREVAPFCVARMLDAGFHGDFPYLVSEHVPGPSLAEVIAAEGPADEDVLRADRDRSGHRACRDPPGRPCARPFRARASSYSARTARVSCIPASPRPTGSPRPAADVLSWARAVLFAGDGKAAAGPDRARAGRTAAPAVANSPARHGVRGP